MALAASLWADINDDGSDTDLDSVATTLSPDGVRSSGRSSEESEESLACSELCSEKDPEANFHWRPNIKAPEFIPTQTMTCLLVGFCEVGNPSRRRRPTAQRPLPLVLSDSTKDIRRKEIKVCQNSLGWSDASSAYTQTGSEVQSEGSKKEMPSKASKGACSPSEWSSTSTTTLSANSETSSTAGAQSEVPETTEEDWERRAQTRSRDIARSKMFSEYSCYTDHIPKSEREADEPMTPDPLDRSISKRHWKYRLRGWHSALQRYSESAVAECSASVIVGEARPSAAHDQGDAEGLGDH